MLKKLRIKFVCINMTIITIMLIFIFYTIIHITQKNLEQNNLQMMQEIASDPLSLTKPGDSSAIRLPYFTLKLDNQRNILETGSSYSMLTDRAYFEDLIDASYALPEKTGILQDYHLCYMQVSTPTSHLLIFMDISTEISTMEHLTRNCILIGMISFFVFLGISIFFANWAVRPVDRAWTQQKQFIADASHELKTPLTVILTNAELLKAPVYDSEQQKHFTDHILIMAKQMQELVEGLLELSRIDNGSLKTIMRNLDLSLMTENALYPFEPLYFENKLTLHTEIEPGIQVHGSEGHLKQVLDILLDNAMHYSNVSSEVTVTLKRQKMYCTLSVRSHGDSLPEEELKNIFKRFYRTDQSRKRSDNYGLGLSIAKSIVEEHRGKIWAKSREGVNTFHVRLQCLQKNII